MIIRHSKKITIIRTSKPAEKDINKELQWLGVSLGLFNLRDKDKSCFRIFIELLKAAKSRNPITSDELAAKLGITRGTIVHHLNKLMDSGIVVPQRKGYMLRVENLSELIGELERDVNRICEDLKIIAADIDKKMSL